MRKVLPLSLETSENKQISHDTLADLAEIVLKNNIFEFDEKTFQKKKNKNVEPLLEPSLHLLMLFFIWLISRKTVGNF